MKIKPLAGYAVIEPLDAEVKTAGGILLPDNVQEKPTQGKVISVGKSIFEHGKEITAEFKPGDVVLYKKWGGDDIKMDGTELKLVKFEDVLAIVDPTTPEATQGKGGK